MDLNAEPEAIDVQCNQNPIIHKALSESIMKDDITAELARSGVAGFTAASAIASSKSFNKNRHKFETDPIKRRRQKNRLLRLLEQIINEYSTRIGEQAIILTMAPNNLSYRVFGTEPLKRAIKKLKTHIIQSFNAEIAKEIPAPVKEDQGLFYLPQITVDEIPTNVYNLSQAHMRNFIPQMVKYSTCRKKPGWGVEALKPKWWPIDVPWANIRIDTRSDIEKGNLPWSAALRKIIICCYVYHGRTDLLRVFEPKHVTGEQSYGRLYQITDGFYSVLTQTGSGVESYENSGKNEEVTSNSNELEYGTDEEITEIQFFEESETGNFQEIQMNEPKLQICVKENGEIILPTSEQFLSVQMGRSAILSQNGNIVVCLDSEGQVCNNAVALPVAFSTSQASFTIQNS